VSYRPDLAESRDVTATPTAVTGATDARVVSEPPTAPNEGDRHNSGATTRQVVRLVRRRAGEKGVRRLLELAGETRTAAQLEDEANWSSYWQGKALFEAAAVVLDDPHAPCHVGEAMLGNYGGSAVAEMLRSLGSPGELLRSIAAAGGKYSTVVRMEPAEITESWGRVNAWSTPGFPRYALLCDYTIGLLSQVPIVFGLPAAEVVEEACEVRGDPHCVFLVRWVQPSAHPEERVRELEAQLSIVAGRVQAMQATVGDLVSAEDLGTVLARITERAGLAVRAPRFVLAVRPEHDGEVLVHHHGFRDSRDAQQAADMLASGDGAADRCCVVVEVCSARRRYGRLAALYDDAGHVFEGERELLVAYARIAAAALDAATALHEARRHGETAAALLELARTLANVGTIEVVAERLARAVPAVVGCDRAAVWLWDGTAEALRLAAFHSTEVGEEARGVEQVLRGTTLTSKSSPLLVDMLAEPRPMVINRRTRDAALRRLLASAGADELAVVPLSSPAGFLGVVVAAGTARGDGADSQRWLLDRLAGLADHAATAFENARLMEQVQHQALHDSLTGLPNERLLRDRVDSLLAHAHRGGGRFCVLFCDLDGFKPVNDLLGHSVGDGALRAVAQRLQSVLRAEDSVCRLGGDEFIVLLPGAGDAAAGEAVAEKVRAALREPLDVDGHRLALGCSVGVAVGPGDGDDYGALVARADAAMYRAKLLSRAGVEVPASESEG